MINKVYDILEKLIERYPILVSSKEDIRQAYVILEQCFNNGGKLLIAGNGGSAADAEHIVGELMKGFVKERKIETTFADKLIKVDKVLGTELSEKLQQGLPAISLVGHVALATAFLNDVDPMLGFAQQVNVYGQVGDILLGISTSGNAENLKYACTVAKAKGMKVIGLTGKDGGVLKTLSDVTIVVDEKETYKIQELHLPIYHALCLMLEEMFFDRK